jgi:15-cis-phytoene synthase
MTAGDVHLTMENLLLTLNEPLISPLVPEVARGKIGVLWDVHARLASLSMTGQEPALRQIRLAWWRDSLAMLRTGDSVPAEPLLQAVAAQLLPVMSATALADLAQARMDALSDEWAAAPLMTYGEQLFVLSARVMDARPAGGAAWALVDAAIALDEPVPAALFAAVQHVSVQGDGPRALRALDRLAVAIARRGGLRFRGREQMLVLRVGLFGR